MVFAAPQQVETALAQLADLGLTDEARNREALAMFDNDVSRAADYLTK